MFKFESHIERIKDLPEKVYWQALEADHAIRTEALNAAKEYNDGIQRLREEYISDLHSIIGEDNLRKYNTLHKKRMERIRSARIEYPPTIEGNKKFKDIRRQVVEKSKNIIDESRVDVSTLKSLAKTYHDRCFNLYNDTTAKGEVAEVYRPKKKSKNEDFEYPYYGSSVTIHKAFSPNLPEPFCDYHCWPSLGYVGGYSTNQVIGADDSDISDCTLRIGVRTFYQVPKAGKLIIRAELAPYYSSHSGNIEDECGYSAINLIQRTRCYFRVLYPVLSPRYYWTIGETYHDTNEFDHSWMKPDMPVGYTFNVPDLYQGITTYLIIPSNLAENTVVYVEVGVENFNYFWSNDCTVTSTNLQSFIIHKIGMTTIS